MTNLGRLAKVMAQYEQVCAPVVTELYASRPSQAREAVHVAFDQLAALGLGADEDEALRLKLSYLAYQVEKAASPQEAHQDICQRAFTQLSQPVTSSLAGLMQNVVLVELLAHAERCGWCELPQERLYSLLEGIPAEERDVELWFYIASWAFKHSDIGLLEEAYEVFLTQPTVFADQYPFQRVKLMHRLLTGKLSENEVADFLGRLSVLPEALEFERHIWPRIEAAGLANSRLEGLLHSTLEQLRLSTPHSPLAGAQR